jgi:DNA primase catalytic core
MMGGHVEEIKSRLPIDVVIGSYVTLEHRGKYLCARCPFHNEKSASFYVSPDRGTYYCFGCGEKGDIFSFVERYEGLDFRGALTELARRAGVELIPVSKDAIDRKEALYSVLETATKYFENNLHGEHTGNKDALDYVLGRGVNLETIKKFRIGYSLEDWSSLFNHLKKTGFSDEIIISAGLAIKGEKSPYDRFRGRIMFPIEDSSGRTIGYSGRILPQLDDGSSGKYVNSPETELYHKSDILYGFSHAKQHIRKHDFSILVEGQFDVVLSHQHGFPNTVAVSGTAFSGDIENASGIPTHLGLLSRLSKNIMLALDSDDAGEKAKLRVIKEALPLGISIKMVKSIPGSKDPADILSGTDGVGIWKDVLKESLPPVEALCRTIINKKIPREREIEEVKKNIYPIIALLNSATDRHESARIVERYFSLPIEYIMKDVESVMKNSPVQNTNNKENNLNTEQSKINSTIKERFYGLVYASLSIDGPIRPYREILNQYLDEIPLDVKTKDENELKDKKEELALEAEIHFERAGNKDTFINDVKLQYEESVFRVIVAEVKNELVKNENDQNLISKYTELQKKIELIKQKRRNI